MSYVRTYMVFCVYIVCVGVCDGGVCVCVCSVCLLCVFVVSRMYTLCIYVCTRVCNLWWWCVLWYMGGGGVCVCVILRNSDQDLCNYVQELDRHKKVSVFKDPSPLVL